MLDVFTRVALAGAFIFTFAWVVLAQRRTFKRLSDAYLRLTHFQRVVVALAVIICTVYAQKPSTNDVEGVTGTNDVEIVIGGDTNDVEIVEGGANGVDVVEGGDTNGIEIVEVGETNDVGGMASSPLLMGMRRPLTSGETPHSHFAAPYRLESVSTNAGYSYAMPADGEIRGTWHLTGAYEAVQKVALDGFAFPLGSDLCTSLWAYTWGKVRPQLKNASNEIAAVGAPMSAIPEVSRFWTAATTNDTYLLTWEKFAAGRISGEAKSFPLQDGIALPLTSGQELASPFLNAQIELFRSGDFITRSNDVERLYRRRVPGIEDEGYGPRQDLAIEENASAYYTIDLVVSDADARVVFTGDGVSNLPDPNFIARANETNTVELLIGKTYEIKCDLPFRIVDASDWRVDVWQRSSKAATVAWPVEIYMDYGGLLMSGFRQSPRLGSPSGGPWLCVDPDWLNGTVSMPTNCCCGVSGTGGFFEFACANGDCGCGGCEISGTYTYEGYALTFGGWECGCYPHEDDPPVPVGVSAAFTKNVIFLENEYANTARHVVPWYSDTSSLCCSALGGAKGGCVWITISGDSNLIQLNGQTLPYTQELQPYETIGFTNVYKAASESQRLNEIEVTATFIENETGWSEIKEPKATAVRVEVEPVVGREGCPNRHRMGISEIFHVWTFPESLACELKKAEGWVRPNNGDLKSVQCPYESDTNGVAVRVDGADYRPTINVIEPMAIVCNSGTVLDLGYDTGRAGGIGMSIFPYIQPEDVCFSGVKMMEIPTLVGAEPPEGYFTNENYSHVWAHTTSNHAREWHRPGSDNLFFNDAPTFDEPCPQPWSYGKINWDIPIGWAALDATSSAEIVKELPVSYNQIFEIDGQGGLKVDKFGQWVKRMPSGEITQSSGIINANGGSQ